MIRYFWKGFWRLIKDKIEDCGQELDSFEEIVEKAVNAEAKVSLKLYFYTCKTNQYCLQGSRPYATKASTWS